MRSDEIAGGGRKGRRVRTGKLTAFAVGCAGLGLLCSAGLVAVEGGPLGWAATGLYLLGGGAAVGQLDPQAVFYLRSRGLSPAAARRLLTYGFASDITSQIPIEPLRAQLDDSRWRRQVVDQQVANVCVPSLGVDAQVAGH